MATMKAPAKQASRRSSSSRTTPVFRNIIPVVAIAFLVVNIALFAYLQIKTIRQNNNSGNPSLRPTPTFTPTPTPTPYPLPQGKRAFQLGYGKNATGPKLGVVTVDPFDPKKGTPQMYTVTVTHTQPVTSVELTLHTDHKTVTHTLKRIDGTDLNGTWQVQVDTDDTHLYEYYAYFVVKSAVDEFRGGLTFRAY